MKKYTDEEIAAWNVEHAAWLARRAAASLSQEKPHG
jgi:hypothetical protein